MENFKPKVHGDTVTTPQRVTGPKATAGSWFARFLDFGSVTGDSVSLSGMSVRSETMSSGHQGYID